MVLSLSLSLSFFGFVLSEAVEKMRWKVELEAGLGGVCINPASAAVDQQPIPFAPRGAPPSLHQGAWFRSQAAKAGGNYQTTPGIHLISQIQDQA